MAETIYWLGRRSSQVNLDKLAGGLFVNGVNWAIKNLYQRGLVGILPKTTPPFAAGMKALTGQPSTSEWTRQQVEEAFKRSGSLVELGATLGAALLFISRASFNFENVTGDNVDDSNGVLVVRYPPLTEHVRISFSSSNTHIVVDPKVLPKEALELLLKGSGAFLRHIGWCYLAMASTEFWPILRTLEVRGNERIIEIKEGGWGRPTIAMVEVVDEPSKKGGWGEKPTPAKTHIEERQKFKGHFFYERGSIKTTYIGWGSEKGWGSGAKDVY